MVDIPVPPDNRIPFHEYKRETSSEELNHTKFIFIVIYLSPYINIFYLIYSALKMAKSPSF
jgi:hypothetical protein